MSTDLERRCLRPGHLHNFAQTATFMHHACVKTSTKRGLLKMKYSDCLPAATALEPGHRGTSDLRATKSLLVQTLRTGRLLQEQRAGPSSRTDHWTPHHSGPDYDTSKIPTQIPCFFRPGMALHRACRHFLRDTVQLLVPCAEPSLLKLQSLIACSPPPEAPGGLLGLDTASRLI